MVASTPPICAEPSELIDSGSRQPASRAASCARCSTTPASTVTVMSTGSIARIRFMRDRLSTSSSPASDTDAPPTMLVLPPIGTSRAPASLQARTQAASVAVSAGRSTAGVRP